MSNVTMGFILTIIAGLSTLLGLIAIYIKVQNQDKIICSALAFAAGVMICVSITDLVPESINMLKNSLSGIMIPIISFIFIILGVIISMLIDKSIPDINNSSSLYKVGIISMLAIILHNIPEGIATFISTTKSTTLGISLTTAIALHNIPEGISIGVPIYYSTKSKKKAFLYTLISALSEPFGALLTYIFLFPYINDFILGLLFSLIAGIMLQISFCELIPESKGYNLKKIYMISLSLGVLFMLIHYII